MIEYTRISNLNQINLSHEWVDAPQSENDEIVEKDGRHYQLITKERVHSSLDIVMKGVQELVLCRRSLWEPFVEKEVLHFGLLKVGFIKEGPISKLSEEPLSEIFSYLSHSQLARVGEVSRKWKKVASEKWLWDAFSLKKLFPKIQILDEVVWKEYCDLTTLNLSVQDAQIQDNRTDIPALSRFFKSLQGKVEEDAGVTLLTMPKGLSLDKLEKFVESPVKGEKGYLSRTGTLDEYMDIAVDKTYRVIITNSILTGGHEGKGQNVLEIGCEIPRVLEVATLTVFTRVTSSVIPFASNRYVFTYCSDYKKYGFSTLVGAYNMRHSFCPQGHVDEIESHGTMALQRL